MKPLRPREYLTENEVEIVRKVRALIEEDLSHPYHARALSRIAGINVYTLNRIFRIYSGTQINRFRHACRMAKAMELLVHADLSIKEIAFELGYKALSNFSESFKRHFGYPPSQLRKR